MTIKCVQSVSQINEKDYGNIISVFDIVCVGSYYIDHVLKVDEMPNWDESDAVLI